jgi:hypothetical protein
MGICVYREQDRLSAPGPRTPRGNPPQRQRIAVSYAVNQIASVGRPNDVPKRGIPVRSALRFTAGHRNDVDIGHAIAQETRDGEGFPVR